MSHLRSCEVSTLYLKNCANSRWILVFLGDWPFISDPYGGTVETSTLPRPVPGCCRRSCEVSTLHLENCANARRVYVFWVINPLFWTPVGYVESSTLPRPVTVSHLRSCEVSNLYLGNCATSRWIHVFWVINPLFLNPMGDGRNVNPSATCPEKTPTFLWRFNSSSWKLCECTSNSRFFGWLTLYFWPLWGNGRNVNPSTTCPGESPTFLWSVNSSSWKLCECTSTLRFLSD